jgi:hypothetical protein
MGEHFGILFAKPQQEFVKWANKESKIYFIGKLKKLKKSTFVGFWVCIVYKTHINSDTHKLTLLSSKLNDNKVSEWHSKCHFQLED